MRMMIVLFDHFEEIEAFTQVDILRRAGVEIDIYGMGPVTVTGRSGIRVETEKTFRRAADIDIDKYGGILLPGGPGISGIADNQELHTLLRGFHNKGKIVFAICAAPLVLDKAGLLENKKFTCFPGTAAEIISGSRQESDVVVDGNLVTSQGVGTSLAAAFKLVELAVSPTEAESQAVKVLYRC